MTTTPVEEDFSVAMSTLVLWAGCLVVGLIGFWVPYPKPAPSPKSPEPVRAEILNVELSQEPLPPLEPVKLPSPANPPQMAQPTELPQAPALIPVALPNAAMAFPIPVEGPVRIVEAAQAAPVRAIEARTDKVTPSSAVPQTLAYGHGEGKQPAPEYPARARREGQEGVVGVQFLVSADGRVLSAEAARPSAWSLLNEAALKVIRERWRFRAGAPRLFDVSIRFELNKK